jgi:SAM-dependent methyltransferase
MTERGAPVDTSYEAFSREPGYVETNRQFVAGFQLEAGARLLDVACGTGTMSGLVLDAHPATRIVGLDLSRESLALARARFGAGRGPLLVEGSATCLSLAAERFDAVLMGNAIHNVAEVEALVDEVRRVLVPGGWFAFNSSFYAGTFPAGTERFYRAWVAEALAAIQAEDRAQRAAGGPGIRRQRGSVARAFAQPWRTPDEWVELLGAHGFRVRWLVERPVTMSQQSFEHIGSYSGLARVLLSGYPVPLACEALKRAVAPAMAQVGAAELPRNWLEVIAVAESGGASARA